jgi:hypothetical protein
VAPRRCRRRPALRSDGKIRIGKHSSALARVRRTNLIWAAIGKRGAFIDMGEVRGIKLPPNTQPPAPSELLEFERAERGARQR